MDISSLYNKAECVDTKEYSLSIRLMSGGFSFSIHNKLDDNSFRFFEKKSDTQNYLINDFETDLLNNELICDEYNSVNVIVANDRFTLIPDEYFDLDSIEKYYYTNLEKRKEKILYQKLENSGCYLIYGINEDFYLFLKRTFTNIDFTHHLGLLTEYFITKSRLGNSDKMFCQIRNGMVDIICYKKGKLVFLNTFHYKHNNDIIYFIMNVWSTVEFNQIKDTLQIASDGDIVSSVSEMLKDYIAQITPVVFPSNAFNLGKECLKAPFDIIARL